MKRFVYALFVGVLISNFVHGNSPSWVLVYSAEDEFCQHMLKRVNDDAVANGYIDPSQYPEVKILEWNLDNKITNSGGINLLTNTSLQNRLVVADVNNDGVDDLAHIWEAQNLGGASDYIPAFIYYPIEIKEMIYKTGIRSNELFSYSRGESIYQGEGLEGPSRAALPLVNLPVQKIYKNAVNRSFDIYIRFPKKSLLFPLIYDSKFYVSMHGVDYDLSAFPHSKKYLIRQFSNENKILDVCYFFDLS